MMGRLVSRANGALMHFYLLIALLLLWQFAPALGLVNPMFVPALSTVAREAGAMTPQTVLLHVWISFWRVLRGFSICAALALPLAFLMAGAAPKASGALGMLMSFLSQIPAYILYPIIVLLWGSGDRAILTVICWSGFWPLLFTAIQGIRDVDPKLILCARAMGTNPILLFGKIILPAVFPNIMRGVRIGLTNSFLILIGAETMGGENGIGWMISNAQRMAKIPRIYLGVILAAALGFLLNFIVARVERRVVRWKPVTEDLNI
ncbi:MAG: ABC transporter permease subunit [Clostridiales bacterium]|jgi:NitT/TauT family transport system permease protein|nr:ABC transporter permease subunit [Clostridiales bacterium]